LSEIGPFQGQHRWLSNFWSAETTYEGARYPTSEHAYQAAKTTDLELRQQLAALKSPADAKRFARRMKLRSDWEEIKDQVMLDCLRSKFQNKTLAAKLIATGNAELVEHNTWGDQYWGVANGSGRNQLGKTLMQVRGELIERV
jgi:ribA/ribD-fused uncharacterized protein